MSKIIKLIKGKTVQIVIIVVLAVVVIYGGLQLVKSQGWLKDASSAVVEDVLTETTD